MNKRQFLHGTLTFASGLTASGASRPVTAEDQARRIDDDQVTFSWKHRGDRLFGELSAPTAGWIAVGFNERRRLKDTRFVIAAVATSPIRAAEHIALVPDHRDVATLGLLPALDHVSGSHRSGLSRLRFSLPHEFPGRPALQLAPGASIHLMLAWSHETDFTHHSAWRRHYDVQL